MRITRQTVRILVPFLLTLCSCGSKEPVVQQDDIKVYMDKFASTYGIDVSYIPATFQKQDGPTIGMCLIWSNGYKEIQIDPDHWATASDFGREELVFHELGHCALGLDHNANHLDSGIPESIMFPYAFGEADYYPPNRPYYFYQLHH